MSASPNPFVEVAAGELGVSGDVARLVRGFGEGGGVLCAKVVVEDGCAIGHGLAHVQHGRQDFVLDLDEVEGVLGDVGIARGDGCYGVSAVEGLLVGEEVLHLKSPGLGRAFTRDADALGRAREVVVGDDSLDAGEGEGLRGVDALDDGVGVRATLHPAE